MMLPENIYLTFGPGTREHQEQIAAGVLALVDAGFIAQELALRGAIAQAYQAGYNQGAKQDGVPSGWQLVPKDLDADHPHADVNADQSKFAGLVMLVAGKRALFCCTEDPDLDHARQCWNAMLAAAPKPRRDAVDCRAS